MLIANANGDSEALQRFCSDEVFAELQSSVGNRRRIYDRFYLNSVEVKSISTENGFIKVAVAVLYSYHDPDIVTEDGEMIRATADLVLIHKPTAAVAIASVYANACATCGAPQKDSVSHTCVYCGAILNDVTREWIVGGFSEA